MVGGILCEVKENFRRSRSDSSVIRGIIKKVGYTRDAIKVGGLEEESLPLRDKKSKKRKPKNLTQGRRWITSPNT